MAMSVREPRVFPGCCCITKFKIQRQVGEGTFGDVYQGIDRRDGQIVALKRLRVENEKDGFPITALREIKLLKNLKHENVITLHDMAVRKDTKGQISEIYMVFPYIPHDLGGLIDMATFKLELPLIKRYSEQLFAGLDYLHSNYILHRDLKSANLLIDEQGNLYVADFGLAKPQRVPYSKKYSVSSNGNKIELEQQQPQMTGMVVTRWYRPPELLLGCKYYNSAIDIWGAGCILGEMLLRRALFAGSSDSEQLNCVFGVCGTPTDISWPSWRKIGPELIFDLIEKPRILEVFLTNIFITSKRPVDSLFVSLIDRLLVLCPENRPTAKEILSDVWFKTYPPSNDPGKYPNEHCHEFEVRQYKKKAECGIIKGFQQKNSNNMFPYQTKI